MSWIEEFVGTGDGQRGRSSFGRAVGIAIVVAGASTIVIRLALQSDLTPWADTGVLVVGVIIAGWLAGSRAAAITTVLTCLIAGGFFANPVQFLLAQRPEENLSLVLLFIECCCVTWIVDHLSRSRDNLWQPDVSGSWGGSVDKRAVDYRHLVEGVTCCAIFQIDVEGKVLTWHETARQLTGFRGTEIIGKSLSVLDADVGNAGIALERRIEAARSASSGVDPQMRCIRKAGVEFWAAIAISRIVDDVAGTQAFAVVLRDITARKHADDLLEKRSRQLIEASRLKDEFLATVSHELRTPLNSILGWTQLFRAGKLDESGRAHALETIEQSAKTQARLIEDLLDVSRIVTGKLRLDIRSVQMSEVIETAVETLRPAAESKDISIQLMLETVGCPVFGDPNRLQQVVWNLLSNAIKFTPSGGLVQVLLHRDEGSIRIQVKDNGMGIQPEFLPHVFDAFRQADSSSTRSNKGLGLGLTIVRRLTELHGGTVRAESGGEAVGTMFEITLPVASTPKSSPSAPTLQVPQPVSAKSAWAYRIPVDQSVRVVVVDDDPAAREVIAAVLSHSGIHADLVSSAAEGLTAVERIQPDVIVSDIEMPNEDGYMFIQELRSLDADRGGRIPAVALTAYTRAEDRSRSLAAGFQMHLGKPIEADELVQAIVSLANQRKKGHGHAPVTHH